MIDIHLHILPGIDDGPETIQESLALAKALVAEGIHSAIATPHFNDEFPRRSASEILSRVYELQQALDSYQIPLRLFAGHEALIKPGLVEDIQTGRLATLNGSRFLLLELWNTGWIPETERVIFELRAFGVVPIIAHPERYRAIQQDPERLGSLLRLGALAQLTASSLIGYAGNTTRRTAETLLKKQLIYCVASDAHGLNKRPPGVNKSLQCMKKWFNQQRIHQMIEIYPSTIVNNAMS